MCSSEKKHVCGSDGNTYTNDCMFRVEACRSQRDLKKVHYGDCSINMRTCQNLNCSFYEYCELDHNGIASCNCPKSCPPVMRPVCGSDGNTYDSACDFEREACLSKSNITIKFSGPCDSQTHVQCQSVVCSFGSVCTIDVQTKIPFCQCLSSCTEEYDPVCGSDGISYSNVCKMRKESCERKQKIEIKYKGLCGMYLLSNDNWFT